MKPLALVPECRALTFAVLVGALFLPGCGNLDLRDVDWEHGAKVAHIERIYSAAELHDSQLPACLSGIPEGERLTGRFAEVSHWQGRARRWKPARIGEGLIVHAGDDVELYPVECGTSAMPVIRKILHGKASQNMGTGSST